MMLSERDLQTYIEDGVEESLTLEYKAAAALGRGAGRKKEITKDVSALANSAGGRIIYGIAEYQDPARSHLPERLDPVDRKAYSKEWLEQVAAQIRPRIEGLVITPVETGHTDRVVYVVDVPQSTTAHQASDYRYYRRHNFQSVPMEDYEIRDVMARRSDPVLEVEALIRVEEWTQQTLFQAGDIDRRSVELEVFVRNRGSRLARYVNGFVQLPIFLKADWRPDLEDIEQGSTESFETGFDNTKRDVVDVEPGIPGVTSTVRKYGPSWYAPILPRCVRRMTTIRLPDGLRLDLLEESFELRWTVYADNAVPREGAIRLVDVEWVSER